MSVSVFTPLTSEQRICATSFCLYFEFTAADLSVGIAQVSPATVIDVADSAEIVP